LLAALSVAAAACCTSAADFCSRPFVCVVFVWVALVWVSLVVAPPPHPLMTSATSATAAARRRAPRSAVVAMNDSPQRCNAARTACTRLGVLDELACRQLAPPNGVMTPGRVRASGLALPKSSMIPPPSELKYVRITAASGTDKQPTTLTMIESLPDSSGRP